MAVDLGDLIEPLKARVNPPGADLYNGATDDSFLFNLIGAFWQARMANMLGAWTENAAARGGSAEFIEGIVTPLQAEVGYDGSSGWSDDDLPRELQEFLILWAAWRITLAKMQQVKTVLRTKAGPVEYEAQQSATLLKGVLDALKAEIDEAKKNIGSVGGTTRVFDAFIERSYSQAVGDGFWVR